MPEPVMPPKALPKSVAAEPGKDEDIEKRDWEKLAPILLDL